MKDKRILITGGSSGIGLALARRFVSLGSHVCLVARDESNLAAASAELVGLASPNGGSVKTYSCDVTLPDCVSDMSESLQNSGFKPDIVVNSAGVARPGYVEEIPLEVFRWTMDINFHGTVNVIKAFLPAMLQRGSGQIVIFSSIAGVLGVFGYTAYSGSKYAVRGFSDALRAELKPRGIHVSIVYPPDTDTPQLHWENQYKPFETAHIAGSDKPIPADFVAKKVIEGILKKRYVITPGREASLYYWMATHLGNLVYPVMDFLVNNARKAKDKLKK